MSLLFRARILLPCALSGLAPLAHSDEPVLITATRFETSIAAAPVNVTVIDENQIRRSAASDLGELLATQANLHLTDLFGIAGTKSAPDLGGFGATGGLNTVVLLNGRRLNDVDLSGANLASIPLAQVARIEIINGSSAVLYGDNATAGAINIVTRSGFEPQPLRIAAEAGSFDSARLSISAGTGTADTAVFAAADGFTSNGYRDQSGFDDANLSVDASHQRQGALYGVRLNAGQQDAELPGPLNEPEYEDDPTQSTATQLHANEDQTSVEGYVSGEQWAGELALRDKHQESKQFGTTEADLQTLSFTPRWQRAGGSHHIIAGLDLYRSTLDAGADFGAGARNNSDTTRASYAAYVTDTYSFTKATRLAVGGRYQRVELDMENRDDEGTKNSDSRDDDLTAWDLTLSHDFGPEFHGYVRGASSFRSPVLDEMWSYFFGTISLLEPQTGRHFEVGSRYTTAPGSTLMLSAARMDIDDEIAFDVVSFSNVNLDPTRHEQVDLRWDLPLLAKVNLQAGYAFRKATFRSGPLEGNEVPQVPKHSATLGAHWQFSSASHMTLDLLYTGERYFGNDDDNVGKRMPDYTIANLGYRYERGDWTLRAKINNLTDERTSESGFYSSFSPNPYYYYPLPERAYYVSVEKRWP